MSLEKEARKNKSISLAFIFVGLIIAHAFGAGAIAVSEDSFGGIVACIILFVVLAVIGVVFNVSDNARVRSINIGLAYGVAISACTLGAYHVIMKISG